MKNKYNILVVIHPTKYQDYDILALGSFHLLEQLFHKIEHSNFIKSSKFGGLPILILDTTDTLRDAISCIKCFKKDYPELQKGGVNLPPPCKSGKVGISEIQKVRK